MDLEIEEQEEQEEKSTNEEMKASLFTSTIEHSRWSPENRICDKNKSFKANMPTYALPGEVKEERIKYVQWIIGNNHHIKTVREVFKNGNNWIEVDFDCEHSRDAAMDRIRRKEGEWLKLIPEEDRNKSRITEQQEKNLTKERKEESKRQVKLKQNEEVRKPLTENKEKEEDKYKNINRMGTKEENTETPHIGEEAETNNYLTIWDLPADINTEEVEYMCRSIKDAKISQIKRSKYKALAVIQVKNLSKESIPWALPIGVHKLARVTKGNEDYNLRDLHSQFTAKLLELPGNASEVLLLRCLRKKGAKSVYIQVNRNGNQRRSATITFTSEKEIKVAQTKPIRFNNYLLFWQESLKEKRENKELHHKKYIATSNRVRVLDNIAYEKEEYKEEEEEEAEKINSNKMKEKHPTYSGEKEEYQIQTQNMLQRILERLERLEIQQNKTKKKI
jgi:hypothetical protein